MFYIVSDPARPLCTLEYFKLIFLFPSVAWLMSFADRPRVPSLEEKLEENQG